MKLFLNVSELKLIREDLCRSNATLKTQITEKLTPKILELCEEKYSEREKLIAYLNELIRSEDGDL